MNLTKKGTIVSIQQIAERTMSVRIKVPDDFVFVAGQYVWLMIPELKYSDPVGNTRMFSIASSPNKKGELEIIFRNGESGYKRTLVEMAPGVEIFFSGPYGPLRLPSDSSLPLIFIAGGVGVAPFLSMIRFSNETSSGHKIILVYANNNDSEATYLNELIQIASSNKNLKLISLSGILSEEKLADIINQTPKASWFVLGTKSFVNTASRLLISGGVPLSDINFEQFYPEYASKSVFTKAIEEYVDVNNPYELAVESTNDHIVITDIDGYILHANKAAERITGYSFEEMKGNTPRLWGGLMPPDFYKNLWQTTKYNLQPFDAEIKNRRKDQSEYYSIVHISPIINAGNLVGFVAIEEDITELKELDIAKSEFISIASHQLRTPVTGLRWITEALKSDSSNMNEKQVGYIKDIEIMSNRLTRLVEDLLNISRVELKSPLFNEIEDVDIWLFANEFIKEMELYAKSKKHTLVLSKITDEPLTVEVNKKSIYNVLQNLISNAIDYSPEDTTVTIEIIQKDDFAKVSVSNQGPAIPPEEQIHLFERFYRAENAKKIKQEGTGLGLYIVKKIVKEIGGEVGLESKDKDVKFWFTVPLKKIK